MNHSDETFESQYIQYKHDYNVYATMLTRADLSDDLKDLFTTKRDEFARKTSLAYTNMMIEKRIY